MANDLELSIETVNIESELYEKGSVAVDARLFSNIVRNLPSECISIKTDNNNVCTIKSGKSEFKLNGLPGEQFPMPVEVSDKEEPIEIGSLTLKNNIKQTIFSVAIENSKPVLTGEYVKIDDGYAHIVAIDGFRVSWRKIKTSYTHYVDMIIPSQTLNEVSRLLTDSDEDKVKIYHSDKNVLFKLKTCTIVSGLIEGTYISYEKLFDNSPTTSITADTKSLLGAFERATIMCNDSKKPAVNVTISNENINIKSKTELGDATEDVQVQMIGDDLSISFNARFIIDVLKNIDEEYIKLNFNTNKSPCIITGISDNDYKYLVLPTNQR
jgi:DNA polymerase-3 subunit beta